MALDSVPVLWFPVTVVLLVFKDRSLLCFLDLFQYVVFFLPPLLRFSFLFYAGNLALIGRYHELALLNFMIL